MNIYNSFISFFAIGLNIFLAIWFTLGLNLGAYGLALASAIVSAVEVLILFIMMGRSTKGLFDSKFMSGIMRMVIATALMSIVTYTCVSFMSLRATDRSFFVSFPRFAIIVAISLSVYLFLSWVFKLQEITSVITNIKHKISRWRK